MHNEVAPNHKRLSLNYHSEISLSCGNSLFSFTTLKELLKKYTTFENYTLPSNKETTCVYIHILCECILAPLKCMHFHRTPLRQTEGTHPRYCLQGLGCALAKKYGYCDVRPFWQSMASISLSLPLCIATLTFLATNCLSGIKITIPFPWTSAAVPAFTPLKHLIFHAQPKYIGCLSFSRP